MADRSIVRVHVCLGFAALHLYILENVTRADRYDSDSKDNSAVEPLGFVEFCIADIPFEKARS